VHIAIGSGRMTHSHDVLTQLLSTGKLHLCTYIHQMRPGSRGCTP